MTNLSVLCGVYGENAYLTPCTYLPLTDIHLPLTVLFYIVWHVLTLVLVNMSTYPTLHNYKYVARTRRAHNHAHIAPKDAENY